MFELVTEEPDVLESDYKRCFKYPFMACETLCTANEQLSDKFLDVGGEHPGRRFREMFKVFNPGKYDEEANSTLTGFVSRITESILEHYPQKVDDSS